MTSPKLVKIAFILVALFWSLTGVQASARTRPMPLTGEGVVIVMLLNVEKGKTVAEAVNAMRDVGAYMRKQPGFIDGALMASSFPGNNPSHIYVSRWNTQQHWEALSAESAFLDLVQVKGQFFNWRGAEVFATVR